MSDQPNITSCPVCHGAVTEKLVEHADGSPHQIEYVSTIRPEQIALALDNEAVARAVINMMPAELRLAIAGVCLEAHGRDGYFTTRDVEDEAEAGMRSLDVSKQLHARNRFEDAAHFRGLSERHQRRAIRITALLTEAEQLMIKQKVHGGPIGNGTPASIQIVKS